MNKKLFKIILVLFIICGRSVSAKEALYTNDKTGYEVVIEDDASLLTDPEKEKLSDEMIPLTKYGHIIFKSIDVNSTTTSLFASNYYHENFNKESGTLFLIDMVNRKIYVFSDGNNYSTISNSRALSITDNVYKFATKGNYYECSRKVYEQISILLNNGKILEPMRYISYFFIAIVISFFTGFLYVLSKSKINKKYDYKKLDKYNVRFNIGEINAIKTGQKSVYSPVSDSSSSSGGSGGGGGSSGGGGGHSF